MVKYKIVLYGDFGVGKTAMIMRLFNNKFAETQSTIGASFLTWKPHPNSDTVMGIWDTAGQERFNSLLPMYLRGSHVVINCLEYNQKFDTDKAELMYDTAKLYSPDCLYYIVQTKIDKKITECINENADIKKFSIEKGITNIWYTSSLTGEGITELFYNIASELSKIPNNNVHVLKVEEKPTQKSINCCNR